eukprot:jgi/Astpho2/1356/Aster-x1003
MTCSECIYVSKILEGELHKLEQGTDKGGLIGGVTLIARIRGPLETDIFASGPAHVRRSMCTDLGGLCPVHQLYDSGPAPHVKVLDLCIEALLAQAGVFPNLPSVGSPYME